MKRGLKFRLRKSLKFAAGIAMVPAILASPVVFSGCREGKKYKIGISQCSNDDWRRKMNEEIERQALMHPELEVEIRSADDSNAKQISDIKYFRDNGFDLIIAAPNEADALTPVIKDVYESGLPVIIFDRNINGEYYTAYQGVNNEIIGESAAKYASTLLPQGGRVLEIRGLDHSSPAIGRHKGFAELAPALNLDIATSVVGNWNYEDAARIADSVFSADRNYDLIYAHNDRMAIAASDEARKKGLNVRVIGVDAAPEIGMRAVEDGVIDATFLYPTEGHRLINTAVSILEGKPYEKQLILPHTPVVDSSNAEILLLQNESLKVETEKIKGLKHQISNFTSRHAGQQLIIYGGIAFMALLFILLFVTLRAYWQRKRYQEELMVQNRQLEEQRDTEKALNEQLNEATQSKLVFFTNVSHDLRTPLTLIAEPVEQLAGADNLTPRQRSLMKIASKNVKILHRLINQILDFRKYENGKLEVSLSEVAFTRVVKDWLESFTAMARKRNMKLDINIETPGDFHLALDVEKMERIFFNIMSNAFKYTREGGSIFFHCYEEDNCLKFSVEDTGRGIPEEDLGHIFDRFYQVDKVHPNGSGIGLSLVKAFVEQMGGEIMVKSIPDVGSKFTVSIPIKHVAESAEAEMPETFIPAAVDTEIAASEPDAEKFREGLPLLLVIDDNDDIRSLITNLLGEEYNIITASDGREGIRLASKFVPDLIICDVMMPVMDGLECCRRIKSEVVTSHIPVLMLTACSMDEQRIQGYESGADGYIAKPFKSEMLEKRCRNLIENRKRILAVSGKWVESTVTAAPQSAEGMMESGSSANVSKDIDSDFYNEFVRIVRDNISDADLNVNVIASKMGLGRSQFYRKIKALTNYTPVELLRNLRLNYAHSLIATSDKSISEIGYESGFASPAYFTRCYREAYGETPTEARQRLGR